jgi:hypothetical protein
MAYLIAGKNIFQEETDMKHSTRFLKTTKHVSLAAAIAAGIFGTLVSSSALAGRTTAIPAFPSSVIQAPRGVTTSITLSQRARFLVNIPQRTLNNFTIRVVLHNATLVTVTHQVPEGVRSSITRLDTILQQITLSEAKSERSSDSIVHVMDREVAELQIMLATAMGGGGGGSGSNGESYCATSGEQSEITEAQAEELVAALNDAAAALVAALDESSLSKMTSDQKAQVIEVAKAVAILLNAARNA